MGGNGIVRPSDKVPVHEHTWHTARSGKVLQMILHSIHPLRLEKVELDNMRLLCQT
jgi:hypothetical protein